MGATTVGDDAATIRQYQPHTSCMKSAIDPLTSSSAPSDACSAEADGADERRRTRALRRRKSARSASPPAATQMSADGAVRPAPSDEIRGYSVCLYWASNVPMAFSATYKELTFAREPMDVVYLTQWVSIYQMAIGFALAPAQIVPGVGSRDGQAWGRIVASFFDGLDCFAAGASRGHSTCGAYHAVLLLTYVVRPSHARARHARAPVTRARPSRGAPGRQLCVQYVGSLPDEARWRGAQLHHMCAQLRRMHTGGRTPTSARRRAHAACCTQSARSIDTRSRVAGASLARRWRETPATPSVAHRFAAAAHHDPALLC